MYVADYIGLALIQDMTDKCLPQSEVMIKGENTGVMVEGKVLEGVVCVYSHCYLLFLSHDCIFEETLTLALVDLDKNILLESLWIGLAYQTDIFTGPRICDDKILFEFLAEKTWVLHVLQTARIRFPISLNALIHRGFQFKSYLQLEH
ncbi:MULTISPECIES: hypothetical protein [Bacteria]|uniref:Uncharacterized protein n=1 Tax=Acinetobacter higginsii TaxID=70347 RepID=N9RSI5_9GAMM|nr:MULTISPECIES: hypothetical protein [Bacteria]ENX58458.1 hypothetical protein F902_02858 [Acinetobacter higginsii]ENX60933.1 hypothetical protein F885_02042 [Acinetobacter higginsii]KZX05357.1 hypothetical protein A4221_09635 [Streptococcus oralis]NNP75310.1 hypothetical protein [Acinetobacter sp. Ac_3412]